MKSESGNGETDADRCIHVQQPVAKEK